MIQNNFEEHGFQSCDFEISKATLDQFEKRNNFMPLKANFNRNYYVDTKSQKANFKICFVLCL